MVEYMSKDAAVKAIQYRVCQGQGNKEHICKRGSCAYCGIMEIMSDISDIPSADVQPVKHGRWVDNTYKYIKELDAYFIQAKCTICGLYSDKIDPYTGYMSNECCSHCGARMDGDTE